ncbi:hypothetical protein ABZP36_027600 [Zizania latifolia]
MGLAFGKLFSRLFSKKEMQILMVGLDAVGKATILYKLKLGEIDTTITTIDPFGGIISRTRRVLSLLWIAMIRAQRSVGTW